MEFKKKMTRDGVIKTYFTNFNLYKHLLSIDEQRTIIFFPLKILKNTG